MDKKKILCVDDDPVFGDLYRQVLEMKGYDVTMATDASMGFDAAQRVKPDLILLDVMMPEHGTFRDGFGMLERLRKTAGFEKTPILMVSALGSEDDVQHGMELGATGYLPKQEMVPDLLIAHIKKHLPA